MRIFSIFRPTTGCTKPGINSGNFQPHSRLLTHMWSCGPVFRISREEVRSPEPFPTLPQINYMLVWYKFGPLLPLSSLVMHRSNFFCSPQKLRTRLLAPNLNRVFRAVLRIIRTHRGVWVPFLGHGGGTRPDSATLPRFTRQQSQGTGITIQFSIRTTRESRAACQHALG